MAYLPAELSVEPEDTTVIGDIEAFMTYVENGQALRDWQDRLVALSEECDAFLREHSHVWSHIIIRGPLHEPAERQAA
ncbi:MAG: hypothetical protein AB7N91_22885 [Candidatus Tectimicrobiota bacterium]